MAHILKRIANRQIMLGRMDYYIRQFECVETSFSKLFNIAAMLILIIRLLSSFKNCLHSIQKLGRSVDILAWVTYETAKESGFLDRRQCDMMARLFNQYLAIWKIKICPIALKIAKKVKKNY